MSKSKVTIFPPLLLCKNEVGICVCEKSRKACESSIMKPNKNLKHFLDKWPGRQTFGIYRFLPLFFALGAALEFSMINWRVGETNFYNVYKRRQAKNIIESKHIEESHS